MASGYNSPSLTAGAAVNPFRAIKINGENQAVQCGAAEFAVGVTAGGTSRFDDSNTNSGDPIELQETGVKRIVAGAAISAGAAVQSDANGQAVTATTAGAGKFNLGVAITAAADAGDVILVAWHPHANQA